LLAIRRDRAFKIGQLLARRRTDPAQRGQVLLGLGDVADHQVGLAGVLVGSTVAWIQLERPPVVRERGIELPELPVCEAEVVVQVGVVWVAEHRPAEALRGLAPVLALERLLARRVVGIERDRVGIGLIRVGGRRRWRAGGEDGAHERNERSLDRHVWMRPRIVRKRLAVKSLSASRWYAARA